MFTTLSLGDPHLSNPEKTAPTRQDGESGYIQVCNKGSRWSEHQRSDIKLRNLAFFVWEDAGLWAHCISSLYTSAVWGQPCFLVHLASCIPPAPQHHWGEAASAGPQLGEPSSHLEARNHWWLWHVLFINMAGDIVISQILDLWFLCS